MVYARYKIVISCIGHKPRMVACLCVEVEVEANGKVMAMMVAAIATMA